MIINKYNLKTNKKIYNSLYIKLITLHFKITFFNNVDIKETVPLIDLKRVSN